MLLSTGVEHSEMAEVGAQNPKDTIHRSQQAAS
jgi:hypothetical protein